MCPAGCATWQGVSKSKKKTQFILLILTFGATVNSLRFYLRAWGKEPFVSPVPVGDTVMYSSSCLPLQCLRFSHVWGSFSAVILSQGRPCCRSFPLHSSQFLNLLSWWTVSFTSALGQLPSHSLSGVVEAFSFSLFSIVIYPSFQLMWNSSAPVGGMKQLHDLSSLAPLWEVDCGEFSGACEQFVTDCWGLVLSENTSGVGSLLLR